MVRDLLRAGAPINAKTRRQSATALDFALMRCHSDTAVYLLEQGGISGIQGGKLAMFYATQRGLSTRVLKALVNAGTNINAPMNIPDVPYNGNSSKRPTALHMVRSTRVLNALLEYGANPNVRDARGWTPLMYYVRLAMDARTIIRKILNDPRINVQIRGKSQYGIPTSNLTPLHIAMACDKDDHTFTKDIITMLIDAGVNVNAVDSSKRTALHWHCRKIAERRRFTMSDVVIIQTLVDNGANVAMKDASRKTPLQYIESYVETSRYVPNRTKQKIIDMLPYPRSPVRYNKTAKLPSNLNLTDPVSLSNVQLKNAYVIIPDLVNRKVDSSSHNKAPHILTVYNKTTVDGLARSSHMKSPISRRPLRRDQIVKLKCIVSKKEMNRFIQNQRNKH